MDWILECKNDVQVIYFNPRDADQENPFLHIISSQVFYSMCTAASDKRWRRTPATSRTQIVLHSDTILYYSNHLQRSGGTQVWWSFENLLGRLSQTKTMWRLRIVDGPVLFTTMSIYSTFLCKTDRSPTRPPTSAGVSQWDRGEEKLAILIVFWLFTKYNDWHSLEKFIVQIIKDANQLYGPDLTKSDHFAVHDNYTLKKRRSHAFLSFCSNSFVIIMALHSCQWFILTNNNWVSEVH